MHGLIRSDVICMLLDEGDCCFCWLLLMSNKVIFLLK